MCFHCSVSEVLGSGCGSSILQTLTCCTSQQFLYQRKQQTGQQFLSKLNKVKNSTGKYSVLGFLPHRKGVEHVSVLNYYQQKKIPESSSSALNSFILSLPRLKDNLHPPPLTHFMCLYVSQKGSSSELCATWMINDYLIFFSFHQNLVM